MKHFQQLSIFAKRIIKLILLFTACLFAQYGLAQPGTLDYSFGEGGVALLGFYGGEDGRAVAIQKDGKILVAGFISDWDDFGNYGSDVTLYRWNTDGSIDTSFHAQHFENIEESGHSIAIQTDGKILVAGDVYNGDNSDFALMRYNTDGVVDSSFDEDGIVVTSVRKSSAAYSVAIQSDGKIVVAGYSANGLVYDLAVLRYNADGSLDTSFSNDGKVITAFANPYFNNFSVAIQTNGKIVVAGASYNGSNYDFATVRYNTNGSLDKSFGADGIVTTAIGDLNDFGRSVVIQTDGKIIVAGRSDNGSNYDIAMARYNTDGSIDNSFADNGKVITDFENSEDYGNAIALQPSGKIVVAGSSGLYYPGNCLVVRYNADGSIDNSFGNNGKVITIVYEDYFESSDYGNAVAIQEDSKIVIAGTFLYDDVWGGPFVIRYNGEEIYFPISTKISYIGNDFLFASNYTNATSWQWDFDGDGIFDSQEQNPQYIYSSAGQYNVKLRINNDPLLEHSETITILPNRGTPYTLANGGNFESNASDFAADNIGVSAFSRGNSTQPGKNGTHSGSNAWVIDVDDPEYTGSSTAYLYSPSYNCTATGNYTISFYAKYLIENEWDGFRVEYSTDKGNTWGILGNIIQANWYDYNNPDIDRPFPQGEAYFSLNNAPSYQKKTFTTNIFQENPNVAFRIVFKSDELVVGAGLAIDDFTLTGPTNVVLPVNLISFFGYNHDNKNILNWKTSTELNSSRYDIERSFDGNNFEKIGSVLSANSSIGSSYSYADDISHFHTNNFYYRLKMVDKDGAYNYSPIISINIRNRTEKIVLLGNVTGSYINIITPASLLQKPLQAIIINMSGAVVKTINISNTSSIIYVDKLAAGKYYLRFIQDEKPIQTEQFIKQ